MRSIVYYPLVNGLTRRFMAATLVGLRQATLLGAAAAAPKVAAESPGPRKGFLLEQPGDGLGNVVVFLHPGDPSAEAVTPPTAYVASVPYSKGKEAGTFHLESDFEEEEFRVIKITKTSTKVAAGTGLKEGETDYDAMTNAALTEHAAARSIDLGGATKKADIVAAIKAASAVA